MKLIQKSNIRVQGMYFNNCIEKNQNKTQFEEGFSSHTSLRDGSGYQYGWIFGKVLNGRWPALTALRMVPFSGNHVHVFHTILPSYLHTCNLWWLCSLYKKMQYSFPKMREKERGSKAVWNISENLSVMVPWPVPEWVAPSGPKVFPFPIWLPTSCA